MKKFIFLFCLFLGITLSSTSRSQQMRKLADTYQMANEINFFAFFFPPWNQQSFRATYLASRGCDGIWAQCNRLNFSFGNTYINEAYMFQTYSLSFCPTYQSYGDWVISAIRTDFNFGWQPSYGYISQVVTQHGGGHFQHSVIDQIFEIDIPGFGAIPFLITISGDVPPTYQYWYIYS